MQVQYGDKLRHELAGAGGWGNARERDPHSVPEDVLNEKMTPARARSEYGVALNDAGTCVDEGETLRLRAPTPGE
jgi:N-methylhydantoinase B